MLYALLRPLLFRLDPETAHELTLDGLRLTQRLGLPLAAAVPGTPVSAMGLSFPNAVGLAAGLDKNGACIDGLAALGFGFIEIGTVTPRPQPGNPKPRLFRLPEHQAIINRMGFNNLGVDALVANVRRSKFAAGGGILGINIGKNFDTPIEQAVEDYLIGLRKVYALASYVTVNISSPNTKNLRQLQGGDELEGLLLALARERDALARSHGRHVPLALKIAPDLEPEQVTHIAASVRQHGIEAIIATNTTLDRQAVAASPLAAETGGLSGAPVFERSTAVLRQLAAEVGDAVTLIGVGGILSGADARAKLDAGARLVQLYSGLIYRGPELVGEAIAALRAPR